MDKMYRVVQTISAISAMKNVSCFVYFYFYFFFILFPLHFIIIVPLTCNHSQRFVAIMCIRPNLASAVCLAKLRLLLLRNIKCIWAVTSSSLAPGVIALNGPEAISAPICNPVNTNEPAPNPTAPSLRQKLPYCCVWWETKISLYVCTAG